MQWCTGRHSCTGTFSGTYAFQSGQQVLYVTERCVFRLIATGLELIEIAPGIDMEPDIMAHDGFSPRSFPVTQTDGCTHFSRRTRGAVQRDAQGIVEQSYIY